MRENENFDENQPSARLVCKKILREEQKGPLTSFCEIKSCLCVGLANRIFVYLLQSKKNLLTVSFIDTQYYLNTMQSIQNLLICGDLHSSCYLLQLSNKRVISYLSKESCQNSCLSLGFVLTPNPSQYKYSNFWVAMSDFYGNLFLYTYQPSNWLSNGGRRFVNVGKMHFGSCIRRLDNVILPSRENGSNFLIQNSFFDSDAGANFIKIIDESVYKRLLMLQVFNFFSIAVFFCLNRSLPGVIT